MADPVHLRGENTQVCQGLRHPWVLHAAHSPGWREGPPLGQERGLRTGTAASVQLLLRLNEEPSSMGPLDRERV